MDIAEYKESIKKLVDATDNAELLKSWKMQLEHDTENAIDLNDDEWELVKEGLEDFCNGNVISLDEFMAKR